MKLQVSASGQGPRVFVKRLSKFLVKNHGVVLDRKKPHIYLSSVWRGNPPKEAIAIHRMDGAYFNKDLSGAKDMNRKIAYAIKNAHGVIYQSKYSQEMTRGILKLKKKGVIIHNGFDSSEYKDIIPHDKMGFDKMLVACAKWRGLKRPRSIVKGFLKASIANAVLVMIGDINKKDRIKHKSVVYTGSIKPHEIYKYYLGCDGLIHISRLDACPNVVVEALVAGKPVLCNNVGGTPEIVENSGVIVDIDPPLKYKMFSMGNPDKIKSHLIAAGVEQLLQQKWSIHRPDLEMKECAKQYYNYFVQKMQAC